MLVPKLPKLNRHRNKSGLQYVGCFHDRIDTIRILVIFGHQQQQEKQEQQELRRQCQQQPIGPEIIK